MPGGYGKIGEYQSSLTKEERKELAVRAGKASVEARAQRKSFKDSINLALNAKVTDAEVIAELEQNGLPNNRQAQIILALMRNAVDGDCESFRLLRDTVGEKPTDALAVTLDKPIAEMDLTQLSTEELAELTQKVADAE